MINILSYKQPLLGKIIKKWIVYHINNKTEYSKMAKRMKRYLNIDDNKLYSIQLNPHGTATGERKRYNPDVHSKYKIRYEVGYTKTNILGSGLDYCPMYRGTSEEEAFDAFKSPRMTYMCRIIWDGNKSTTEYYNRYLKSWE